MTKSELIVQDLEKEYLSSSTSTTICDEKRIKALIWNFFNTKKYLETMSYKDYSDVMTILFDRLK